MGGGRFEDYENFGDSTRKTLIEALKEGDQEAWDRIVETWGITIRQMTWQKMGNADANDVAQLVLLKMFNGIDKFSRDGVKKRLRFWVPKIIRNEIANFFKGKEKPWQVDGHGGLDNDFFNTLDTNNESSAGADEMSDGVDDEFQRSFDKLLVNNLIEFLLKDGQSKNAEKHKLNMKVVAAFKEFHAHDVLQKELAEELGMSAQALRTRFSRLKQKLIDEFDAIF